VGTLTGVEIENEIRYNLGNREDLDSRLYRFINFAQDQLARFHPFDELEVVESGNFTSGVGTISVPSKPLDVRSFRLLDDSRSRKLVYYTPRQFDQLVPDTDWHTQQRPTIYTQFSKTFEVWRIPDNNYEYKIRYKKSPTKLTANSSFTLDFDGLDDVIIALATSWAFRSLGEREKASWWIGVAAKAMGLAKDLDLYKADHEPVGSPSDTVTAGQYWKNPFIKGVR
jgi:hypothetical protein